MEDVVDCVALYSVSRGIGIWEFVDDEMMMMMCVCASDCCSSPALDANEAS